MPTTTHSSVSPRQRDYIVDLFRKLGASDEQVAALDWSNMTNKQASGLIDELNGAIAKQPKSEVVEPPEGIHFLDGQIYKVQVAKQGSGRKYAKHLQVTEVHEGKYKGSWEYNGRKAPFSRLSDDTLMDRDQAAQFGHLYGICGICGADLTDEGSISRGIGPVCAKGI